MVYAITTQDPENETGRRTDVAGRVLSSSPHVVMMETMAYMRPLANSD